MATEDITATTSSNTILPHHTMPSMSTGKLESLRTIMEEIETTTPITTAQQATTENVKLSVNDLSSSLQLFGWADYFVFVLMLIICAVIGIYFGFVEKSSKKKAAGSKGSIRNIEQRRGSEALDYLVGGRKMQVFPVSLSLVASFVSGISLLGTSTEIYVYGTQYAFLLITVIISGFISWHIFLPVFCNLQLTSTYEYFEMRFDRRIRLLSSVLFVFGAMLWLPIVIYVPALAFNQVTGVNIHIITPVVCLVCIFYTCVGGLKAVVWTDVIQSFIMLGSIILVITKGTMNVGGIREVISRNYESGRIEAPLMDMDHTVRFSIWSVFIGSTFHWLQNICADQILMQRFLSVPDLKAARKALVLFIIFLIILLSCCIYNGLLIYATYYKCDPLKTKLAKAHDQLLPLLVMDTLGMYPGFCGLFISGVFSAALSSLSTGLNSITAICLEDFIKPYKKTPLTGSQTKIFMKSVVVICGLICIALVFVVEKLGMVLQLSATVAAVSNGPILGLFFIGILLPWINGKSALTGGLLGFGVMGYVGIRSQMDMSNGILNFPIKPTMTDGCDYSFNQTIEENIILENQSKPFHHLSYLFYTLVGSLTTTIGATLATLLFGATKTEEINPALIAPFLRRFIKTKKYLSAEPDIKENQEVIRDLDLDKEPKGVEEKLNYS